MAEFCKNPIFRWVQLILAICGLSFALSGHLNSFMVTIYVLILIYIICMMICALASKTGLSSMMQAIIELVMGILLLAYTIYYITANHNDVFGVLSIVSGFLLAAMLFITAYEKLG